MSGAQWSAEQCAAALEPGSSYAVLDASIAHLHRLTALEKALGALREDYEKWGEFTMKDGEFYKALTVFFALADALDAGRGDGPVT